LKLFEFLDELSSLTKRGIKSSYITKDKPKLPKRQTKNKRQIKYNFIHKERFFVDLMIFKR